MKEHLVTQLKTQISDLERFIEFLQGTNIFCSTLSLITSACVPPPHFTSCFAHSAPCVLVWLWCTGNERRNHVDDSGLAVCCTSSLSEWFVAVWRPPPWLCLYPVALFPVSTTVHELLDSQDERTAGLWNIINHSPDHTMSFHVRLESSALPPWEPQISLNLYCTG